MIHTGFKINTKFMGILSSYLIFAKLFLPISVPVAQGETGFKPLLAG